MADLLLMDKINALPQPLRAKISGTFWEVHDIDVETGLMRINVSGLLEVTTFSSCTSIKDMEGVEHNPDDFYNEDQP